MKHKRKIIIFIIVLLIIFLVIFIKMKSNKEKSEQIFNGNPEVLEIEEKLSYNIKTAFSEVEESYKTGVEAYSGYARGDFYNETRLNQNMTGGELSFVNADNIDTENLYDTLGNKQENLPSTRVNDKDVEISNSSIIEDENYYLLRCTSNSAYTYYYIIKLEDTGNLELNWYCYTENEAIDDLENNLENDLDFEIYNDIDV